MTTRRSVLGDAHVDRAEAAKTDFDAPFQDADHRGGLGLGLVAAGLDASASGRW